MEIKNFPRGLTETILDEVDSLIHNNSDYIIHSLAPTIQQRM